MITLTDRFEELKWSGTFCPKTATITFEWLSSQKG